MKTKQEQIKAIAEIIKAKYKEWLDTTGVIPEGTTYYAECLCVGEDCAEIIIDTVYDVVTEFKAQNKKLKEENDFLKYCQCLTNGVDGSNYIKQAKIDVLNQVKEKCSYTFTGKRLIAEPDIDEIIKEVEAE